MINIDMIAIEAIEKRIKMPIEKISTKNETMFVSSAVMATVEALSILQKEYETKISWISVNEKDAPSDEVVLMKLANEEIRLGYFKDRLYTSSGFILGVTHWRSL